MICQIKKGLLYRNTFKNAPWHDGMEVLHVEQLMNPINRPKRTPHFYPESNRRVDYGCECSVAWLLLHSRPLLFSIVPDCL